MDKIDHLGPFLKCQIQTPSEILSDLQTILTVCCIPCAGEMELKQDLF